VVINRQRRVRFNRAELDAFLARLEAEVAPAIARGGDRDGDKAGGIDVVIVSDTVIRHYNRRFRSIDKATDVLSFEPSDLMISVETARRQARRFGHCLEEEMKILALHGVLHLLGHDHERDGGVMARLERRWRRRLGLPLSLTERAEERT